MDPSGSSALILSPHARMPAAAGAGRADGETNGYHHERGASKAPRGAAAAAPSGSWISPPFDLEKRKRIAVKAIEFGNLNLLDTLLGERFLTKAQFEANIAQHRRDDAAAFTSRITAACAQAHLATLSNQISNDKLRELFDKAFADRFIEDQVEAYRTYLTAEANALIYPPDFVEAELAAYRTSVTQFVRDNTDGKGNLNLFAQHIENSKMPTANCTTLREKMTTAANTTAPAYSNNALHEEYTRRHAVITEAYSTLVIASRENPSNLAAHLPFADGLDYPAQLALFEADLTVNDPVDEQNNTPLHYAVTNKDPNAITHLLRLGANASAANASGISPWDVAFNENLNFLTLFSATTPGATKTITTLINKVLAVIKSAQTDIVAIADTALSTYFSTKLIKKLQAHRAIETTEDAALTSYNSKTLKSYLAIFTSRLEAIPESKEKSIALQRVNNYTTIFKSLDKITAKLTKYNEIITMNDAEEFIDTLKVFINDINDMVRKNIGGTAFSGPGQLLSPFVSLKEVMQKKVAELETNLKQIQKAMASIEAGKSAIVLHSGAAGALTIRKPIDRKNALIEQLQRLLAESNESNTQLVAKNARLRATIAAQLEEIKRLGSNEALLAKEREIATLSEQLAASEAKSGQLAALLSQLTSRMAPKSAVGAAAPAPT